MIASPTRTMFALWVWVTACVFFAPGLSWGQNNMVEAPQNEENLQEIYIQHTDLLHFAKFGRDSVPIRKLIGNVALRQDSTYIYCDSALQFLDTNLVLARGHVVIHMQGGRKIRAEELDYQGDTKILTLNRNVELSDTSVVLYTQRLIYYRQEAYGAYTTGGKLVSKENVLTSKRGHYYPDNKMAYFREKVVLVNPDYTLTTDTLGYNTDTRIAFFLAPTKVKDSLNDMYTEDGYYDTENDFAYLHTRAHVGDSSYTLFADTILYDQRADFGKAKGHVVAEQKDSTLTVFGKYAEFKSKNEELYITDSTFAVQMTSDDTLYLVADTLLSYTDTLTGKRFFDAYHHTRLFMRDIQGVCDSLSYGYDDSVLVMYRKPFLWSGESQLLGDTIQMGMKNGGVDTLSIPSNPMIVSKEDTVGFNQIKGKDLQAKFEEKRIKRMFVAGNCESVYFTEGDGGSDYIGMNAATCSSMRIDFEESKPSKILFEIQPEGVFYPMSMIPDDKRKLPGFVWNETSRPVRPEWAFRMVESRYGPLDTLMRKSDTLMWQLDRIARMMDEWMLKASPQPEAKDTTEDAQQPVDSLQHVEIVDSSYRDTATSDSANLGKTGLKPNQLESQESAVKKNQKDKGKPTPTDRVPFWKKPKKTTEERQKLKSERQLRKMNHKMERYESKRLKKLNLPHPVMNS